MLRGTLRRLGGSGGGDLFPTSKEAAHLTPSWVMGHSSPPPPGAGMCRVAVTRRAVSAKWQLTQPEVHSVAVVPIDAPSAQRLSGRAMAATRSGVCSVLNPVAKQRNGVAAANIAEKERGEAWMKTRDYTEQKRPVQVRSGWEQTTDLVELSEWMYARIHDHRKLKNDNSMGYQRERMLWDASPTVPAVKK